MDKLPVKSKREKVQHYVINSRREIIQKEKKLKES